MRLRDEQKEALIREKAIELIVREGFGGFSMQKLARAADVSPATLYIYYKNKLDLLNSLYIMVHEKFSTIALRQFSPDTSLEEGLWIQWRNRMQYIVEYPLYFQFSEQFKNSPLIHHEDVRIDEFKENMRQFVMNAIHRGQLLRMEPELFWALAFGPFYSLMRFHLMGKSMMHENFQVTEAILKALLQKVIKALSP